MKNALASIAVVILIALVGATLSAFSGMYDIGADTPHWPVTRTMIEVFRDRSIAVRTKAIDPPNLADEGLVLKGAGQYAAMCVNCHLAPGISESEIRPGLYPQPPDLSKHAVDSRAAFWVIKHGIKMTAMPAWGRTHDDATIWSIVAFVSRLPHMSPQAYKDIVAKAPPDEDMKSMDRGSMGRSSN